LVKARILLKADASEAGEGWRDSQIATALDTSVDTVARTRQQLVEEGLESVLTHKHSPASASKRIFDGAAEAKLVAVACFAPPKGRARWTLKLLETAVVEMNIVHRASDNTIEQTPKRYAQASKSNGLSRGMPTPPS
jgi:poly-gamma-glutamate capsule biosynthesis protein CapA/YwtB (metallophosphatase superfamily)